MSATNESYTCGELLTRLLRAYGVELVFGIPGVHTVELYRGLPASGIRHITPRHEQGAGFMADGYARVSGKPGVCWIITGPGMSNILTAMAQAKADSVPMLVISSVNPIHTGGSGEGHLHELDNQQALVSQVCAFSQTVWRPEELPKVLARAFTLFAGSRPQPVHIQLPLDVIRAEAGHVPVQTAALPLPPQPHPHSLDQAAALLADARQPVVLYGGGCRRAAAEAQALAETLDAPVALTINAKGLLPPGHPLSTGSNQSLPAFRQLLAEADVVLAVGTELGETDYDVVFDGGMRINGRLIRADIDPAQLNRPLLSSVAVLGDAAAVLDGLNRRLRDGNRQQPWQRNGAARAAAVRAAAAADFPPAWQAQLGLLQWLRRQWPDAVVVGDSTQPVYSGNHGYEALAPGSWFNAATGYGTLGYALPAGIGAALATGRPVVALVGDGGLQFTLSELISGVEAGVPLLLLVWNNQGYDEIRRYMQRRGLPAIGVDIRIPDFALISRGMGAHYAAPNSVAALQQALQQARSATVPTVVEISEGAAWLDELAAAYQPFA